MIPNLEGRSRTLLAAGERPTVRCTRGPDAFRFCAHLKTIFFEIA